MDSEDLTEKFGLSIKAVEAAKFNSRAFLSENDPGISSDEIDRVDQLADHLRAASDIAKGLWHGSRITVDAILSVDVVQILSIPQGELDGSRINVLSKQLHSLEEISSNVERVAARMRGLRGGTRGPSRKPNQAGAVDTLKRIWEHEKYALAKPHFERGDGEWVAANEFSAFAVAMLGPYLETSRIRTLLREACGR